MQEALVAHVAHEHHDLVDVPDHHEQGVLAAAADAGHRGAHGVHGHVGAEGLRGLAPDAGGRRFLARAAGGGEQVAKQLGDAHVRISIVASMLMSHVRLFAMLQCSCAVVTSLRTRSSLAAPDTTIRGASVTCVMRSSGMRPCASSS